MSDSVLPLFGTVWIRRLCPVERRLSGLCSTARRNHCFHKTAVIGRILISYNYLYIGELGTFEYASGVGWIGTRRSVSDSWVAFTHGLRRPSWDATSMDISSISLFISIGIFRPIQIQLCRLLIQMLLTGAWLVRGLCAPVFRSIALFIWR